MIRRPELQPQSIRLLHAIAYLAVITAMATCIVNQSLPPLGTSGLWFWAGLLPLVVGRLITEPTFVPPSGALANGVALVAAAAATDIAGPLPVELGRSGQFLLVSFGVVVLILSVLAIGLKDLQGRPQRLASLSARALRVIGGSDVVYSLLLLFVTLTALGLYDPIRGAAVGLAWGVVVIAQPLERLAGRLSIVVSERAPGAATVESSIDPRIVVIRSSQSGMSIGSRVEWPSGASGRIVDMTSVLAPIRAHVSLDNRQLPEAGELAKISTDQRSNVVGFAMDGSDLESLTVRVPDVESRVDLAEGDLLIAPVDDKEVLYQVTNAHIDSKTELGLSRQITIAQARKLGKWLPERGGFETVPWVPSAGASVMRADDATAPESISGIGRVPRTSYQVGFRIGEAVTHNTAILGILGVGKTSLSLELIRRMLLDGMRVVVLDITGEYVLHLGAVCPAAAIQDAFDRIENAIAPTRNNTRTTTEQAGNLLSLRPAIEQLLDAFYRSDSRLLILNPSSIDATAGAGYPQGGNVPLRRLSTSEVTRHIVEAMLEDARRRWPADPASPPSPNVCIVFEEAHSLVPEIGSRAEANDQAAVAATSRAVLQGRKHGLGCLLITQRTANVTKSILNQCHTIFAMRSFDATSEAFLENYIGKSYSTVLPNLSERHAVLFGRGSNSQAPVIVQLNDREQFKGEIWNAGQAAIPTTNLGRGAPQVATDDADDLDLTGLDDDPADDLPF